MNNHSLAHPMVQKALDTLSHHIAQQIGLLFFQERRRDLWG